MMILRFIVLAGVVVAIGLCVPTRARAANLAATSPALGVPALGVPVLGAGTPEPMKGETPARPRPKPGPKDGGEDE